MGGKSSPPPAPDYAAAAKATAQGNLDATRYATEANRVNQYTPYGSITWSHNPTNSFDQAGYKKALADYQSQLQAYNSSPSGTTPGRRYYDRASGGWVVTPGTSTKGAAPVAPDKASFYKSSPDSGWAITQSLSPEQQALFDQNMAINRTLGNVAEQGLGYVQTALDKPLAFDQMQALQDPGQIQQQASEAAYQNAVQYLDPQFQRQQATLESQLANQGITRGSEAWNNAMQQQDMAKQQAYSNARNQAYLQGLQGAQQSYGQAMGTRQQQIGEAQTLQQNPINMLNAIRSGQQMQVAQMPNQMNVPMQQATAGPDYLGAAQGQYNAALGGYNAQQAGNNAMLGGLFQLGSAAAPYMFSDRRLKKNIVRIGTHAIGLPMYAWEYLWGEKSIGVMADEVEKIMPHAVKTHPSGFKMVNYSMLEV